VVQHLDLDDSPAAPDAAKLERKPRAKKPKEEPGYMVRFDSADTAHVQKWVAGEVVAEYVYRASFGTCTCEAAQHGRACKHAALVARLREKRGEPKSPEEADRIAALVIGGMAAGGLDSVEEVRRAKDAEGRVTMIFLQAIGRDFPERMTLRGFREGLGFEVRCIHAD
jgi:hypothetical protein